MAVGSLVFTVLVPRPDKVVGARVEMQHLPAKRVRRGRSILVVPRATSVGSVVEELGVRYEVGTIEGVFVVVECQEAFVGEELFPCVTFVR